MSFFNYLKKGGRSPAVKYKKLSKNLPERQKRKIETKLLKPEKIPPYTGRSPIKNLLDKYTVKIILSDDEQLNLFKKYFKVTNYIEQSVVDISLLTNLLKNLDQGLIEYDQNKGKFKCRKVGDQRKSKMGRKKPGFTRRK